MEIREALSAVKELKKAAEVSTAELVKEKEKVMTHCGVPEYGEEVKTPPGTRAEAIIVAERMLTVINPVKNFIKVTLKGPIRKKDGSISERQMSVTSDYSWPS